LHFGCARLIVLMAHWIFPGAVKMRVIYESKTPNVAQLPFPKDFAFPPRVDDRILAKNIKVEFRITAIVHLETPNGEPAVGVRVEPA
jgi:hypothetical protein